MELAFADLPEWEAESLLTSESDPVLEIALTIVDELTYEQQIELLERLGIDYSKYAEMANAEPVTQVESFADLF